MTAYAHDTLTSTDIRAPEYACYSLYGFRPGTHTCNDCTYVQYNTILDGEWGLYWTCYDLFPRRFAP